MSHDQLAESLAGHLRSDKRMTWCNLQLGPSGSVRPDVYAIFKSYVRPCPTAYEVKVSASDFRSDVTSGKWQSYLKYACGVYFACEAGLIAPKELPEHCGLIVFKNAWRIAKKAVLCPVTIPQDAFLKLLIDGVEREGPAVRQRSYGEDYRRLGEAEAKFGKILGRILRDRLSVEREIETAKYQAKSIVEDARMSAERIRREETDKIAPLRRELCEVLGLPHDAPRWKIQSEVKALRESQQQHPAVENLRTLTASIASILERYGHKAAESEEIYQ